MSQTTQTAALFDAIVLAGGDSSHIDAQQPVKGLLEIAGKPMVAWAVEALMHARSIARIIVVIPPNTARGSWADGITIVEHEGSLLDNCESALAVIDGANPLLWLSADVPAITPEAIDDYTQRVTDRGAELTYPMILETDINRVFPGSVRTYMKLREGRMTGGNLFTCTLDVANKVRPIVSSFIDARKDPMAMVRLLGPGVATKFALGSLSIADVERRIDKGFGIKAAGIITPFVEIGVDVDKPADVAPMEKYLQNR